MPLSTYQPAEPLAQIILSAVAEHDQQLGVGSLALILKGSRNKRLTERKLYDSKFFGSLLYYPTDAIENFIKQLMEKGYIRTFLSHGYSYTIPFLELTDEGRKLLDTKGSVHLELRRTIKPVTLNDSVKITLELFQNLRNVLLVAQQRNLAESTILGHLAACITLGLLAAVEVVDAEKMRLILEMKEHIQPQGLKELKEALPEQITYGEIKCVLAEEEQK